MRGVVGLLYAGSLNIDFEVDVLNNNKCLPGLMARSEVIAESDRMGGNRTVVRTAVNKIIPAISVRRRFFWRYSSNGTNKK